MNAKKQAAKRQIHRKIKKHIPKGVHKVKKIVGFKYPKLLLLIFSFVLAYYIFSKPVVMEFMGHLNSLSYIGMFFAGLLLAFGFSTPFGIAFFITAHPESIFLATLLGGIGAMLGDIIIFRTIKFSFMDEFERLKKSKVMKEIEAIIQMNKHLVLRHYLLYIFAGLVIATPLPDEIGVSMLAGLTTIKPKIMMLLSFLLHSLVILGILYFSSIA